MINLQENLKKIKKTILNQTKKNLLNQTEENLLNKTEKTILKQIEENVLNQTEEHVLNEIEEDVLNKTEEDVLNEIDEDYLDDEDLEDDDYLYDEDLDNLINPLSKDCLTYEVEDLKNYLNKNSLNKNYINKLYDPFLNDEDEAFKACLNNIKQNSLNEAEKYLFNNVSIDYLIDEDLKAYLDTEDFDDEDDDDYLYDEDDDYYLKYEDFNDEDVYDEDGYIYDDYLDDENKIVTAKSKNIRISPSKISKIICKIREKTYIEALDILKYLPQKSGRAIWKTLYSVAANAYNNHNFNKDELVILQAFVNQGPMMKRSICGSKGSSKKIEKKSSHITIVVGKTLLYKSLSNKRKLSKRALKKAEFS